MLKIKSTNIFSEIGTFFSEKDNSKAISRIMEVAWHLKLSDKVLSLESAHNCKYTRLVVFQMLLLFPFFMVKNAFHYTDSMLYKVLPCKKDIFYRFMSNGSFEWRKILYRINLQLIDKIIVRSDSKNSKDPVCLIIDDSDLPKKGMRIERVGRIFSHVTHASILGFKALFLCRTDGKTQTVLDFSLHGEEGRKPNKPFGTTKQQRERQYRKTRNQSEAVNERINDYTQNKIQKAIDLVKRAVKEGIRFDYLLAESWFTCTDLVRFIKSRHTKCHYLSMIKMSRTKYCFDGKLLSAKELVKSLHTSKSVRYSRRLRCYCAQTEVTLSGSG